MAVEDIPQAAGKGFFGSLFGGLGAFFKFFFSNWRFFISMLFVFLFVGHAIYACLKQNSFMPLVMTAGQMIANQDEIVYQKMLLIEANDWRLPSEMINPSEKPDTFWRDLKSSFGKIYFCIEILGCAWFIYIFGYLWYKLISFHNKNEVVFNLIFAIVFMALLEITYSLAILHINETSFTEDLNARTKETFTAMTPLKGLFFSKHSFFYNMVFTGNLWKHTFVESAVPFYKELNNMTNSSAVV